MSLIKIIETEREEKRLSEMKLFTTLFVLFF